VHAVDWGGYFRAGPGATKKDVSRACYGLNGPGLKYRLGNECDFYGEFLLSQGFEAEGVAYKAHLMTNLFNGATDTGDSDLGINQMYVEGKGYDIAPDATFWIGKRFYGRADVHIVDTFYVNLSGVGAGVDGIAAGPGKLNLAWFRTDGGATEPGSRLNADLTDIAVNPGGKLRLTGTVTDGSFDGGTSGVGLSAQHNQDNVFGLGGGNTLWLQYAQGSAGLDGNFGTLTAPSGSKSFRIVESLTWQMGALGGQAQAMWQNDKDGVTGVKTNSSTIGGRMSYALTKHLKLLAEAGYSQKKPDGAATQKLAKLTVGPALSTGPGFWKRPELRLYVTTARWNQAANAAAGAGGVIGIEGETDDKTRGTSYGAQVEIWF
ncbi:maltoporin, partial [Piscinibacter sp.]|uniref:maltoporin n=1 Tax=Piscinibacter sp. TaxID=1903157 RepID=UPI002C76B6D5